MRYSPPGSGSRGCVLFFGLIVPLLAGCAPDVQQSLRQDTNAEVVNLMAEQASTEPQCESQIKAVIAFYSGLAREEKGTIGDADAIVASDTANVDTACGASRPARQCKEALLLMMEHLQAETHLAVQLTGDAEPDCAGSAHAFDACMAVMKKFNKVTDCVNSKQTVALEECGNQHSDEDCANAVENLVQCSPDKSPQIPTCGALLSAEGNLERIKQAEELDAAQTEPAGQTGQTSVLGTIVTGLVAAEAAHATAGPNPAMLGAEQAAQQAQWNTQQLMQQAPLSPGQQYMNAYKFGMGMRAGMAAPPGSGTSYQP